MMLYNPFNHKNRLFKSSDVHRILEQHKCFFKVRHADIFQTAMVHSSYVKRAEYTTPTGEPTTLAPKPDSCLDLFETSYERLEHLGDSVLGAIVATYLITRFPDEQEGFLTDLKKEIVCNEMLGQLSQKIGLDSFYIISRHNEDVCNGRTNLKKLGDIFEAFIGALWTDSDNDFKLVYNFVIELVETYIDIPRILMNNRNYKEQFQKVFQSMFHSTPTYSMLSQENGIYTMGVMDASGTCLGVGKAPTKKQAEQWAAREALAKWRL
jgi:ribonuclease-3